MGAHTKIIDLFGTPACGKSTLARYLKVQSNLNIGEKSDVSKECCGFFHFMLIWSISIREVINCIKYHFAIPPQNRRKGSLLWKFIKDYSYYSYIQKYSSFDVVILDNGIIQSIISHQNGADLLNNTKYMQSVMNLLFSHDSISYWWCDVDPKVSFERMRKRNRTKGRIEMKASDKEKQQELIHEHSLCEKFYYLLLSNHADARIINCEKSIEDISDEAQTIIDLYVDKP